MSRAEQFHFPEWQENYHVPKICTALILSPFIHVMDNHFYRLLHTVKWFGGSSRIIWAFSLLKYTLINHNVLPASLFPLSPADVPVISLCPSIWVPTYSHSSSLSFVFIPSSRALRENLLFKWRNHLFEQALSLCDCVLDLASILTKRTHISNRFGTATPNCALYK